MSRKGFQRETQVCERRAESGKKSLESGEQKNLVEILTESGCITLGLGGINRNF